MFCAHCGLQVSSHSGGTAWSHDSTHLNRCQDPKVPYGHEAHPANVPCPAWCLGSREEDCFHYTDVVYVNVTFNITQESILESAITAEKIALGSPIDFTRDIIQDGN